MSGLHHQFSIRKQSHFTESLSSECQGALKALKISNGSIISEICLQFWKTGSKVYVCIKKSDLLKSKF